MTHLIMRKKDLPTKICAYCNVEKDKSEFYKQTRHFDGLQGYCKECAKWVVVDSRRTKRIKRQQKLLARKTIPYTLYRLGRLQRTMIAILQEFTKSQVDDYPNTGYIHRRELALTTAEIRHNGGIKNWRVLVKDFLKRQAISQDATTKTDREIVEFAKRVLEYRKISKEWLTPSFSSAFHIGLKTLSNKGLIDLKDRKLVRLTELGEKLNVGIRVSKQKIKWHCKSLDT